MGLHQRLAWHNVCPTSHEVCVAASPTCHPSSYHSQQPNLTGLRVSLESAGAQQLAPSKGRPAVNSSESNCAHFLDARLELFWAEDWSALWAMVRAECDVAPVQNTTRRTEKQQMQSRVRKVATLARTGEKGRALAAARNAPAVPVTEQVVQEIKSLYPADPEPLAPVPAPVSALFLSEVAEHVPTTLRKMPRLSEPGPLGMRAEHWYDFGSLAGNSDLFVQIIAHIAAAAVPTPVLHYVKDGQITPLAKPTGGHRPLLMMSFLRKQRKNQWPSVRDLCSTVVEDQKTIQYLAEADNSRVLVALDLKAAFQSVSRRAMLCSITHANRCGSCSCLLQVVHRLHGAQNALRFCLH